MSISENELKRPFKQTDTVLARKINDIKNRLKHIHKIIYYNDTIYNGKINKHASHNINNINLYLLMLIILLLQ